MLKALMLGNIIAQVATPTAAVRVDTTPMITPAYDHIEAREQIALMIQRVNNNDLNHAREIAYSIPGYMIERHFGNTIPSSHTPATMKVQEALMEDFLSTKNSPAWNSMSIEAQTLARTMLAQFRNYWSTQTTQILSDKLYQLGYNEQWEHIQDLQRQLNQYNNHVQEFLNHHGYRPTEAELQEFLRTNYYQYSNTIDEINYGRYSDWSSVYHNIQNHLHDFHYDANNIPNLNNMIHNVVSIGKVAAALHLENMKTYQKVIMWVSSAFTLLLSIGIFMTLIRVGKQKSSKKLKTLLIVLGTIMLLVAGALGVMPFIGGN